MLLLTVACRRVSPDNSPLISQFRHSLAQHRSSLKLETIQQS
jgi:hypothetical protein